MKTILVVFTFFITLISFAQEVNDSTYIIKKTTGGRIEAVILEQNEDFIRVQSKDGRTFKIPQHEITEIILIDNQTLKFSDDRYILTANAMPIKKGNHYFKANWYGPAINLALSDHFSFSVQSTWIVNPLAVQAQYRGKIKDKLYFGAGLQAGAIIYNDPGPFAFHPYANLSYGSQANNVTLTLGQGFAREYNQFYDRTTVGLAGIVAGDKSFSFVYEAMAAFALRQQTGTSYIMEYDPNTGNYIYNSYVYSYRPDPMVTLSLAARWNIDYQNVFQFGLLYGYIDDDFMPIPFPLIQFSRAF